VQIYGACAIRQTQVWIQCGPIDNGKTDVDDKQRSGSPGTSTTDGKVFSADALIIKDGNLNWADKDRKLRS